MFGLLARKSRQRPLFRVSGECCSATIGDGVVAATEYCSTFPHLNLSWRCLDGTRRSHESVLLGRLPSSIPDPDELREPSDLHAPDYAKIGLAVKYFDGPVSPPESAAEPGQPHAYELRRQSAAATPLVNPYRPAKSGVALRFPPHSKGGVCERAGCPGRLIPPPCGGCIRPGLDSQLGLHRRGRYRGPAKRGIWHMHWLSPARSALRPRQRLSPRLSGVSMEGPLCVSHGERSPWDTHRGLPQQAPCPSRKAHRHAAR